MKPYYSDESVTLYLGDFRKVLPKLDLSIDLLIADPPYGETTLTWDRWPDGWPSIAAQHARSMWCFGSMRMFLDRRDEFADWRFSQDTVGAIDKDGENVVWEKHNGSGLAADRFKRVHEHALFWYRGPWAEIYHTPPTTPDATARTVRRKAKPAHHQGARGPSHFESHDGGPRLMRSVIYARSMHGRAINETEKPEQIVQPLVEYGCPPGGLVVDIFSGSGVTGVVAKMTGRRAVLIEEREHQCELAADRLAGLLSLGGTA